MTDTKLPATQAAERAIWERALQSRVATPTQALQLYSDPGCWVQVNAKDEKGDMRCYWSWNGLIVPPYELAQKALRGQIKEVIGFNPLATLDLTDAFRNPPYCEPGNPIDGWDVFDRGEGVLEIQRVDESARFKDDKEAAACVVAAAKDTSTPEARALLHLFSVCLAPIIEQAKDAKDGQPFTVVLNAQQAEMIKRLRYW